jgi:hypothetical protein
MSIERETARLLPGVLWAGLLALAPAEAFAQLREGAMVPPPSLTHRASVINASWIELELEEAAVQPATAGNVALFVISSPDDPAYRIGVHPSVVHRRTWPESAWYADQLHPANIARIQVTDRLFLQLPRPLMEHRHYRVEVGPSVAHVAAPLDFEVDPDAASESVHVNQVAFPAEGPKVGYLSAWTGQGAVDFGAAKTFELVDVATGSTVFTGDVHLGVVADQDRWSKSNVYAMDFSAWTRPGTYRVRVPTVGASYAFSVGGDAMDAVFYTVARGLLHQRDGRHGLDAPTVTRWNRPAAHLDDAVVESSGAHVDLVGGHMDAGDRGKYPHNLADAAASMLAGAILFPEVLERVGESLQLPESGNGTPDWLDEAMVDLDFLVKLVMNTSQDGTVPFYLRPSGGGYEQGVGPEGEPGRVLFDKSKGPYRAETLYVAGALAMACNTPLLRKVAAAKLPRYREAALRAFHGFVLHASDPAFWKDDKHTYDPWTEGKHPWSDEMLVAAANLYQLTGDAEYLTWIKQEMPDDPASVRHYHWSLEGPWLNAYLSVARVSRAGMPAELREAARKAILSWADAASGHDGTPYDRPYGMPLPTPVRDRVGWYFSASAAGFPLMMAYGVSGEARYRDEAVRVWSWLLGGNPLNRTFISGLGRPDRRPRWGVHEIAQVQWSRYRSGDPTGWSELVPGIPSADLQSGEFDRFYDDAWNKPRRDAKFPVQADYAPLFRYSDSWNTGTEFTIDRMARGATSLLAILSVTPPTAFGVADETPAVSAAGSVPAANPVVPPRARSGCGCLHAGAASSAAMDRSSWLVTLGVAFIIVAARRRGRVRFVRPSSRT